MAMFEMLMQIVNVIFTVVTNLFLILVILTEPNMRRRLFFKSILLIAVTHFLQGVLVYPLYVAIEYNKWTWTHDKDICTVWYLTDLSLRVVLAVLFLMLVFERFLNLTYPEIVSNKCLSLLMLLSPWILGTLYVVFLYIYYEIFADPSQSLKTFDGICSSSRGYVQRIYSIFGFICPAIFIFGFSWTNFVVLCLLKKRHAEVPPDDNLRSNTTSASIVALAFIFMWLPANISMIMLPEPAVYVRVRFPRTILLFVGFFNSAFTPSLWFVVPVVKRGFYRLLCCCCSAYDPSRRHQSTHVTSPVDEIQMRMLGHDSVQPSTTTNL